MHFDLSSSFKILVVSGAGVFLTACNPATKGWSSVGGGNVSFSRLVAAKDKCGYRSARRKAIKRLKASGDRAQNEQRAAQLLSQAEQCMSRKYGINYHSRSYGIGRRLVK